MSLSTMNIIAPQSSSPGASLGEKLLRGWTMLAESCSECSTPLMKQPVTEQGASTLPQCVNESCPLSREATVDQKRESQPQQDENMRQPIASSLQIVPPPPPASSSSSSASSSMKQRLFRSNKASPDEAQVDSTLHAAKAKARMALANKISVASEALETANIEEALKICEALEKFGEAADALVA